MTALLKITQGSNTDIAGRAVKGSLTAGSVVFSNGDNSGVLMGVVSQTVMGPSRHITGAFTVLLKGTPCTRMTSLSVQNRCNIVGMRIVPSQFKVLVLAA